MEFNKILEGWRNHLFPPQEIKDFVHKISEERLAICKTCPNNSTPDRIKMFSFCKNCGCPLIQKSKSLSSECPVKNWLAIATPEEQEEIRINNEKNTNTDSQPNNN